MAAATSGLCLTTCMLLLVSAKGSWKPQTHQCTAAARAAARVCWLELWTRAVHLRWVSNRCTRLYVACAVNVPLHCSRLVRCVCGVLLSCFCGCGRGVQCTGECHHVASFPPLTHRLIGWRLLFNSLTVALLHILISTATWQALCCPKLQTTCFAQMC